MQNTHIYTAGLFDGEGTVSFMTTNKGTFRCPHVSMSSTTKELLEFLVTNYGGTIRVQKRYKAHHKPAWVWGLRYNAALNFLEQILPYMKEPEKVRRASLLVSEYKSFVPRNGKYTEELLRQRADFETRFFS